MRMFIGSPAKMIPELEPIMAIISNMQNLRAVGLNNFHLTYLFLGEINLKETEHVVMELNKISCKKFPAKISGIRALPNIYHPRVIVLSLESPHLDQLYNSISLLLPEYANNEKKFLPHITIARVRNRNSIPDISRLPTGEGMLPINELCLFKSILTREGSIYERIWCNEFY
jgi:2'-5' RNA ligase